jgi:hypothetical protein
MIKNKLSILMVGLIGGSNLYAAKAPIAVISGSTVVTAGWVNQKIRTNGKRATVAPALGIGLSDVYFTATGETDFGFTYLWRANITAIPGKTFAMDRNYLQFGHNQYGTTQIGSVSGVEDTFVQSALRLIGGAAGIDGGFSGFFNKSTGILDDIHILGYTKRATKLVYSTPVFNGVQFGMAYTPNTSSAGRDGLNLDSASNPGIGNDSALYPDKDYAPYGINNVAFAISYVNAWEDYSINLNAVYIREDSKLKNEDKSFIDINNVSSYQLGCTFGYKNLRFAGNFIDNGQSRLPKNKNEVITKGSSTDNMHLGNAARMWDIGAQYKWNALQFAVAYFRSDRNFDDVNKVSSDVVTTTVDYNALPGLKFFAEVDFASFNTCKAATDFANSVKSRSSIDNNTGQVFIVGSKISF